MDKKEKQELSELDICDLFITPAVINAGWDQLTQIRRNVTLTPGPVIVRGNLSSRNKKKKFADYVLQWEKGVPIAVIEAKCNNHTASHGMQQALGYSEILEIPSTFSSNGDAFASHNKVPEPHEEIETEFSMDEFPSPQVIWQRYKTFRNIADEDEKLVAEPYHEDGTDREPRYYQAEAINRIIERIAKGDKRLLLVMATGTGKTYTTFQIIWRLWKAKKVKRILFLVDRNILADQTLMNDFKPFGSVMTKIKNRKIDPSYEIYLGLYQALISQL
ncbi:DEAD/DEAH box helicase family protein [Cellvibrio sp. UBA7671]|uniref:DEAD/DEAH box helicase family protein n=1 Tax=Cellvibrio sp. UBA7671 TaxID=1946312 RepID=UPI002F3516E8